MEKIEKTKITQSKVADKSKEEIIKIDIEAEVARKVAEELAKIKAQEIKQSIQETPTIKIKNENTLNMDSYSTLQNLCSWDIYFSLVGVQGGDRMIKANSTLDILNRDTVSLCNNSNIFFVGEDGQGNHARIYIKNPDLRISVGFDSEDGSRIQSVLDESKLEYIFSSKTQRIFEENVKKEVIAFHEKDIIMNYARKIKENNYERISFLETYCNRKFKIE